MASTHDTAGGLGLQELVASPALYPVSLDQERRVATLVSMTRDDYRRAAFHERKPLRGLGEGTEYDLSALLADPPSPDPGAPPVHYVLHMAFCCSTLLGRAADCLPGVFCLREPAPLNRVTMWAERERDAGGYDPEWQPSPEIDAWLRVVYVLLQRSYPGGRCNVVKTLPQSTVVAPWLLARDGRSRALFLFVDPTTFLCQTLRTPRRRAWTRRSLTFTSTGWEAARASLADCEVAARLWATRMEQYRALRDGRFGARVQALEGGRLAVDRDAAVRDAVSALAIPCDEAALAQVVADPLWDAHAKGQHREYDAFTRQEVLERVRLQHRPEIRRGLRWLADHVPWFAPDRPEFGV
jgi:hypothetical protein